MTVRNEGASGRQGEGANTTPKIETGNSETESVRVALVAAQLDYQ